MPCCFLLFSPSRIINKADGNTDKLMDNSETKLFPFVFYLLAKTKTLLADPLGLVVLHSLLCYTLMFVCLLLKNSSLLKSTHLLPRYVHLQPARHGACHSSPPESRHASVLSRLWWQRSVEQCLGWHHFGHWNDTQRVGKLMCRFLQNVDYIYLIMIIIDYLWCRIS